MTYVTYMSPARKNKLSIEEKKASNKLRLAEREKNSQIVTGTFKNLESPGGDAFITYHQYKEDPTAVYHMWDNQEYKVPLGVAKQINNVCKYKKSKHLLDKDGKRTIGRDTSIQRYQFISNDFM